MSKFQLLENQSTLYKNKLTKKEIFQLNWTNKLNNNNKKLKIEKLESNKLKKTVLNN
jgi:hypothetical protein